MDGKTPIAVIAGKQQVAKKQGKTPGIPSLSLSLFIDTKYLTSSVRERLVRRTSRAPL